MIYYLFLPDANNPFFGLEAFSVMVVTWAFKIPPVSTTKSLKTIFTFQRPVERIINSFEALISPSKTPPIVMLATFASA